MKDMCHRSIVLLFSMFFSIDWCCSLLSVALLDCSLGVVRIVKVVMVSLLFCRPGRPADRPRCVVCIVYFLLRRGARMIESEPNCKASLRTQSACTQLLPYRHHQERNSRQSSVPPWVFVSFLAMPDGVRGGYPAPIDLKPSDFSEWIASQECTDSLAEALEMANSKILEYTKKKLDLEKALKERGAKKEHHEEEQVAQEEESPESPKKGVGQNIRSIIQQIEQGTIDGIQLNFKNITQGEAKALAEAMVANAEKNTIKTLDLYGNKFADEGVMAFSEVIANENSAVEKLNLGGCDMTDLGAFVLAEALKKNETVKELNINGNGGITARGIGAIAKALGTNSRITSLRVNDGVLDRDGASHLAQALRTNSALKAIYLGFNQMMGKGAADIARALRKNRSLEVVNLSYCDINDDTVNEIALALQENKETALMMIDLSGNNITDAGAERLVQALNESKNQTILDINLRGCSVSSCSDKRVRV